MNRLDKKEQMDEYSKLVLIFVIVVLALLIIFWANQVTLLNTNINELGTAICKEKYNYTFVSYDNKILKCSNNLTVSYDGIKIQIGGSN